MRKLTRFWTPKGRFRWTRLHFGISTAPEECQRCIQENLKGLKGIVEIADDWKVCGKSDTIEQAKMLQDNSFKALLERTQQRGMKFNKDKCKIRTDRIKYMGHLITTKVLKHDPRKVEAITKLKPPTFKDEVRRFMGYIVYLSRFLPKLSMVSATIRDLLIDDSEWMWDSPKERAFSKLLKMIIEAPT